MQIVVHELTGSHIKQQIEVGDNPLQVAALRPSLVKWLNPIGSLKMRIRDESDTTTIAESEVVTIQSITDATDNYFHGPVKFEIAAALQANTKYTVVLMGLDGYSFSESSYIGWENGYDLKLVPNSYTPASTIDEGLMLEIWTRNTVQKGSY